MVLIPKGPVLPRDEHEAQACVLVHPLGHALSMQLIQDGMNCLDMF